VNVYSRKERAMYLIRLFLFTFVLILFSCASKTIKNSESVNNEQDCSLEDIQQNRTVAKIGNMCSELFEQRNGIGKFDPREKIVDEFAPGAVTDGFWKIVGQLALNSNSKIVIDSHGFTLTQVSAGGTRISASYIYDAPSNNFLVESIKYSKSGITKDIALNNGREYSEADLNNQIRSKVTDLDSDAQFNKAIPYKVYEKVRDELTNLNLFTTHELLKISKMDRNSRLTKYSAILNARKLKVFLTKTLLEDFLYKPLRGFVISVLSIYLISSQLDVGKHLGLTKEDVPTWVAPSIVNMTTHQSAAAQKEAIVLMKLINSNKSKEPKEEGFAKVKSNPVKINETDFYTIKKNNKDGRTYFILTHENENGNLDVFFQEINPAQFKNLAQSAIK
jgi:hypothetical protein